MAKAFMIILFTGILTENFVLRQFLGICPFLGVSKKRNTAMGMSAAVIFVMVLATAVTFPINKYLLEKNGLEYLQTIVFILVIAALVQLVEIVLKKYVKPLYNALGIYLPLITTNCAVLGVALLNVDRQHGLLESLVFQAHPYRWPVIGWMDDIARIGRDDCLSFFRTYYAPGNASVYVCGDVDPDDLLRRIEGAYGGIGAGPPVPPPIGGEPRQRGERRSDIPVQPRLKRGIEKDR